MICRNVTARFAFGMKPAWCRHSDRCCVSTGTADDACHQDCSRISTHALGDAESFALGASAMGDEELDAEMDDFVTAVEGICAGKTVGLFGSYDWGDGEWMRKWADRMTEAGATVVNGEGVIANLTPDDDAVAACKALGAALAK